MKTKLTVTFAGQTFTRRTDRTYTHVVVGKSNRAQALAQAEQACRYDAKVNYPFYVREAGDTPQYEHDAKTLAAYRSIAAMSRSEYRAKIYAERAAFIEQRDYESYVSIAWAGRPDLAAKAADKARKDGWLDVQIIPVEQA